MFTVAFISPDDVRPKPPPLLARRLPPKRSWKNELKPPPEPKLLKSKPSKGLPPPKPPKPPLLPLKASACFQFSPYWSYFLRFSGSPITL